MERSDENVRLIQDVLAFIRDWASDPEAMEERGYEATELLNLLELRYGVRVPKRVSKRVSRKERAK